MEVKEEYDVLRLIEYNQVCYVSSEFVKGKSLPQWIKYHPFVEKESLFRMINGMAGQLSKIHRCRGNPCYRYVNPYSIIVSEEGEVSFLDMNAKSNNGQLRLMKRRVIREHFLPPDEPYYQKESIELDIYGLGRTWQYLLSETDIDPPLSRSEEAKFQKIISKCLNRHSKKTFQNISEIQRMIPKYRQFEKGKKKESHAVIVAFLCICIAAGLTVGGGIITVNSIKSMPENKKQQKENRKYESKGVENTETEDIGINEKRFSKSKSDADGNQEEHLGMELGVVYFLRLKDYEKSKECFEKVKGNALAENMAIIAGCLAGNGIQPDQLRNALSKAESESGKLSEEQIGKKEDYYLCTLRGYVFLSEEEDLKNVLRIGEKCRQNAEQENLAEILGYLALANEGLGEFDTAVSMYDEQMKYEKNEAQREGIYKKMAYLLEQSGKGGQAQEVLRKGIEEIENSKELRTNYIGTMLKNPDIERALCIQSIKEQLKELPELAEYEEFIKLLKEHGITVGGE